MKMSLVKLKCVKHEENGTLFMISAVSYDLEYVLF